MNKRDKLSTYITVDGRNYLLFKIINMGTEEVPDLKITTLSDISFLIKAVDFQEGAEDFEKIEETPLVNNVEMSYHKDGSFLNKVGGTNYHDNPYGEGARWTPISGIHDLQPVFNISIKKMAIYNPRKLEPETGHNTNYVCCDEDLFEMDGTYEVCVYIKPKNMKICRIAAPGYYSDIIVSLNNELDICIYIQRHRFEAPKTYFSHRLNSMIQPYAMNIVSFCNKDYCTEELKRVFANNVLDPVFYDYIQIVTGGNIFRITNKNLNLFDAVDKMYDGKAWPIRKVYFLKALLSILDSKQLDEFINMDERGKQLFLNGVMVSLLGQAGYDKDKLEVIIFDVLRAIQ